MIQGSRSYNKGMGYFLTLEELRHRKQIGYTKYEGRNITNLFAVSEYDRIPGFDRVPDCALVYMVFIPSPLASVIDKSCWQIGELAGPEVYYKIYKDQDRCPKEVLIRLGLITADEVKE